MTAFCIGLEIFVLGTRLCLGDQQQSVTAVTVCPVIQQHSAEFQKSVADELRRTPAGAALKSVTAEWINLRDQARKCRAPISEKR